MGNPVSDIASCDSTYCEYRATAILLRRTWRSCQSNVPPLTCGASSIGRSSPLCDPNRYRTVEQANGAPRTDSRTSSESYGSCCMARLPFWARPRCSLASASYYSSPAHCCRRLGPETVRALYLPPARPLPNRMALCPPALCAPAAVEERERNSGRVRRRHAARGRPPIPSHQEPSVNLPRANWLFSGESARAWPTTSSGPKQLANEVPGVRCTPCCRLVWKLNWLPTVDA